MVSGCTLPESVPPHVQWIPFWGLSLGASVHSRAQGVSAGAESPRCAAAGSGGGCQMPPAFCHPCAGDVYHSCSPGCLPQDECGGRLVDSWLGLWSGAGLLSTAALAKAITADNEGVGMVGQTI